MASLKHMFFITRRNICLLTLLAVLFQAFFAVTASATASARASLQPPISYTICHHFGSLHSSRSQAQCLQHPEASTGGFSQNLLVDDLSLFSVDKTPDISTYFNQQTAPALSSDILLTTQFENLQNFSKVFPVFLRTTRLRI